MKLPSFNTITQQEFLDHIEDDDFLLKYGNPVMVLVEDAPNRGRMLHEASGYADPGSEEAGSVLMCMAIEYYERMTGRKVEIPEDASNEMYSESTEN